MLFRLLTCVLVCVLALSRQVLADSPAPESPTAISHGWVATDALGRSLPEHAQVGDTRPNRTVALFYWTWHIGRKADMGPVNVQEIVTRFPDSINDYEHPIWESVGRVQSYHWNEPLLGYYRGTDPWVLRKHAELLADAGVDVVVFDCTNGTLTWKESYDVLGEVWCRARKEGVRTPQFAFLCPFSPHDDSRVNVTKIYQDIYEPRRFEELWFHWKGKPLIMAYPDNLPESIRSFFTFRPGQPDYRRGPQRPDHWGWLEVHPQHGYVPSASGSFEQMTVGVAQNATDGLAPAAMNDPDVAYGRGYTQEFGFNHDPLAIASGLNFQEQWDYAIQRDPELIFITGWNEWIAGRYQVWQGTENAFPDQFNDEYSRDIEPMKGGFSDNFYYQMVGNIRRYKGIQAPPAASAPISIDLAGSFDQWSSVRPLFRHHPGSTMHRNHRGFGQLVYENYTGRNDIVLAQVARDPDRFYFLVETTAAISLPQGDHWMCLLIDTDRSKSTGWEGYDFAINRTAPSLDPDSLAGFAVLERASRNGPDQTVEWEAVAKIPFRLEGNRLMMSVPRQVLGISSTGETAFEFKWVDNVPSLADITDFYRYGEAAPGGRFNYLYRID
jgi:hypothetical protein